MITLTQDELSALDLNDSFVKSQLENPIRQGHIHYVFKSKATKYPARIYLFVDGAAWPQRNRRVMGCMGVYPFAERAMTRDECISNHFAQRLKYHQYDNIDALIKDEIEILESSNHPLIVKLTELKTKNFFKSLKNQTVIPEQINLF